MKCFRMQRGQECGLVSEKLDRVQRVCRRFLGGWQPRRKGTVNWSKSTSCKHFKGCSANSGVKETVSDWPGKKKILPCTSPYDCPDGVVWTGYFPYQFSVLHSQGPHALGAFFFRSNVQRHWFGSAAEHQPDGGDSRRDLGLGSGGWENDLSGYKELVRCTSNKTFLMGSHQKQNHVLHSCSFVDIVQ